jgi:hypothetical protein
MNAESRSAAQRAAPPAHASHALPRATAWPVAMAGGITLTGWGLIASPVMLVAGAILFVCSLVGWIGEIRHERPED